MAKTTNLGLNLTTDESTKFSDWRKSIDGNNSASEKSNMQILDEAIGELQTRVNELPDTGSGDAVVVEDLSSESLETDEKTLVGAINEVAGDVATLESQVADLLYKPISITSFGHNKSILERGVTVSDVTLSWSTNKTPTSLTLDGSAVSGTSKAISGLSITWNNNKTWSLVATDERGATATKSTTLTFQNGVYYGVSTAPETYTSNFIQTLTKQLSGSKVSPITVNAGTGQYIYYCLPTRLGECTFSVGGFTGGFSKVATIEFTNASGYSENYYIYKSDKANLGSTVVSVS
jgi:hypothetical protein